MNTTESQSADKTFRLTGRTADHCLLIPPRHGRLPAGLRKLEGRRWDPRRRAWRLVGGRRSLLSLARAVNPEEVIAENVSWPQDASAFRPLDLTTLLEDFRSAQLADGLGERTAEAYTARMKYFLWYVGTIQGHVIRESRLAHYLDELVVVWGLGQSHVNQTVGAIKQFYRLVLSEPSPRITGGAHPYGGRKRIKYATSEREARAMSAAARCHRDRVIISLLFYCGLKIDELQGLRVQDVNLPGRLLHVRGQRSRSLPFPAHIVIPLLMLTSGTRSDWFLFHSSNPTKPLSIRRIQDVVAKAADHAGVAPLNTPGALRDGCAIRLLGTGRTLAQVAEFLGVTERVTESYFLAIDRK